MDTLGNSQPLVTAHLFGRFVLKATDGRDLTPKKSTKAQGLMALLLMAPGYERSREYLMDKLWSDRQPTQSARSLKTELYVIRSALRDLRDLLISDGGSVRLDPDGFARDMDAPGFEPRPDQEFCEGLAVRDPEFVNWLEEQRRALSSTVITAARPLIFLDSAATGREAPLQRAVLGGGFQHMLADWCAEQLVTANGAAPKLTSGTDDDTGFLLEQIFSPGSADVAASLSLTRLRDGHLLWHRLDRIPSDPSALMDDSAVYRAINASVDRTIYEIAPPGSKAREARYLERGTIGAVRLIFRNQGDDIDIARRRLSANFEASQQGLYLAWLAYTLAFFKGERGYSELDLKDEAEELARRSLELEPHNSMVLALISYVYTYLLGAPQFGLELAERSTDVNRANPMGWAFKGAALYTLGQFDAAYECTRFARQIAGDGPYRYAVETYFCIASTLSNNIDDAINAGETAARLKPDFRATLRYLAVLYAHRKEEAKLAKVLQTLRRDEPDFSIRKMLEISNYPSEILRTAPILDGD